ncbi:MAG: hypothetical protein AAB320_05260 [Elusimicrobiota bacterium]
MDIKKEPASEKQEMPAFKLAKVGGNRRKAGGGLSWLGAGAGAGGGASSGAGGIIGSFAAMGGKMAVMALVGTLGAGAYGVGKSMAPDSSQFKADKKPKAFASVQTEKNKKYEVDTAKLPKSSQGSFNSLGMVSGSLDGKTPEQRAGELAAAEAAQKAEADKAAKAQAEADKEQPTPASAAAGAAGAAGAMDPAAMAAAAAAAAGGADKDKKGMSNKFGEMSKGLGGGLAGGGGMSSGVGRGFDTKIGGGSGRALAFGNSGSNAGRAGAARTRATPSGQRGLARRQLDRASSLSNQARSGTNEARSSNADAAFNNNPGAGTVITGGGAGAGRSPTNGAASGPSSSGGGGSGPTASEGSEYGDPDDCASLGSNFENSAAGGCVLKTEKGKSVDPTDKLFDWLKLLSIIATVISVVLLIVSLAAKTGPWGAAFYALQAVLAGALVAIGAIMAILGLMLVGMGRNLEGGIFTLIGLATSITGYMAYTAGEEAQASQAAAKKAGEDAAKKLAMEAAQKSALTAGTVAGGVGAGTNAAGGIYANNIDSRTLNSSGQWD